jgi:Peptidase family M23
MLQYAASSAAQPMFELSTNVYRVPYSTGFLINVTNNHFTHDPLGRYDMSGTGIGSSCSSNYPVVAAAEGIIRMIVDNNNVRPPLCDPNCADFNNYVWIEHTNGEWSKYSHMKQNSTTVDAGLTEGDQVCAGTFLGYECDVGQASGPHLHFEVRRPNDTSNVQIQAAGGFMTDAVHLIPVINSLPIHYFADNAQITASAANTCTNTDVNLTQSFTMNNNGIRIYMASGTITTAGAASVVFQNGSNGLFHAGNSITLSPGFAAAAGSSFLGRIGNCSTTALPGGCN